MGAKDSLELETRLRQAIYWFDSLDFEQAIVTYQRIICDFPDNDWGCEKAWAAIGEIHMLLREMDMVEASFSQALSYNPRNPNYHYQLGFIDMFCHHPQRAIAEIDYCVKQDPERFTYQWVSGGVSLASRLYS